MKVSSSKLIRSSVHCKYWMQILSVQKKVAKIGSKYCRKDISVQNLLHWKQESVPSCEKEIAKIGSKLFG